MLVNNIFWIADVSSSLLAQPCLTDADKDIYNCNNVQLGVLPSTIPPNTRVLLLSNSNLTNTVPPLAAFGLVHLTTLDLSYNKINSFYEHTFTNLTALTYLDIRGNYVLNSFLPKGVFSSLHRLETLKVTISQMTDINVNSFLEESATFRLSLKHLILQQGDLSVGA